MPTDISVRIFWPSDLHDEVGFSVVFCSSCFTWTIVSHMWCCILANNPFLDHDCFSKLIPFHRDATFAGLSHFLCTLKCRMFSTQYCTAYWSASTGSLTWLSQCLPQCYGHCGHIIGVYTSWVLYSGFLVTLLVLVIQCLKHCLWRSGGMKLNVECELLM